MSHRPLPPHRRLPSTSGSLQRTNVSTHRKQKHRRNGPQQVVVDTCPSEGTFTDQSLYDLYQHHNHHHGSSFSEDSASTRLPSHCDDDDESCRRLSRNTFSSERSCSRRTREKINPHVHKDVRRVYPEVYPQQFGQAYHEIQEPVPVATVRRMPDRPQSSMSSGMTSAIIDGCGGRCETFENICYFFLQLIFMMGILIGVSLCIAGLVLRKSAARNLQVLVYIGILLAIVSGSLLGIQWNARHQARKRKMAVKNAKRAPIPMETLHPRPSAMVHQPLMAVQDGQRVVQQIVRPPLLVGQQQDEQGVPWWRRKDLA